MEGRVETLEKHVQKLQNIVWVVGVLAVIFGISGGWGLNVLSESQKTISTLEGDIKELVKYKDNAQTELSKLRIAEQSKFVVFVNEKKSEILGYVKGAVVSFEDDKCPTGWMPYEKSYGRFIRGLDLSGNVDPDGTREPGMPQEDMFKSHKHSTIAGQITLGANSGGTGRPQQSGTFETGPKGGSETRPKNIALLYCIKA